MGVQHIKIYLENEKLRIVDEETYLRYQRSYAKVNHIEASDGNHDDIMMNLVMFGYFCYTEMFRDLTDINIKQMLYDQKIAEIENDIPHLDL